MKDNSTIDFMLVNLSTLYKMFLLYVTDDESTYDVEFINQSLRHFKN